MIVILKPLSQEAIVCIMLYIIQHMHDQQNLAVLVYPNGALLLSLSSFWDWTYINPLHYWC